MKLEEGFEGREHPWSKPPTQLIKLSVIRCTADQTWPAEDYLLQTTIYRCTSANLLAESFFLARNSRWIAGCPGETTFKINILSVSTLMSAAATFVHLAGKDWSQCRGKFLLLTTTHPIGNSFARH